MFFRKPQITADLLRIRYLGVVLAYVATRVGCDAAEDITAEVFAAVLAQPGRVPKASPSSDDDLTRAGAASLTRREHGKA